MLHCKVQNWFRSKSNCNHSVLSEKLKLRVRGRRNVNTRHDDGECQRSESYMLSAQNALNITGNIQTKLS